MKLKNSINFFKYFKNIINLELRKFYLNTSYYDGKISKLDTKNLNVKILDIMRTK